MTTNDTMTRRTPACPSSSQHTHDPAVLSLNCELDVFVVHLWEHATWTTADCWFDSADWIQYRVGLIAMYRVGIYR